MNLLKLVCVFALLGVTKFVYADLKCVYKSSTDNNSVIEYLRCNYTCHPAYNNVHGIFTHKYDSSSINEINFENCLFNDESIWQGVWRLMKLNISNSHLTEIPAQLLFENTTIQQLDISNNFIRNIESSTFAGVPNLLKLNLSNNSLTNLHENVFDPLVHLKELDLSYNPIENLQIETFAYLQQLEILSLKHAKLNSIRLGIFLYQHKLISLDLSENNLKTLDCELYDPMFYDLQTLDLSENQLTDLNDFRSRIFPQLTLLDIRANHFTCSHLQSFIDSTDWSKLRLANDPQLTKEHKLNIRGVNCKNISD